MTEITVSPLPHTWLIDLDGTLLQHNGHLLGCDQLLPGVEQFWNQIPPGDTIIVMSARTQEEQDSTLQFLKQNGLRFDRALFALPIGERILVNDIKPKGLQTAIAVNLPRDAGLAEFSIKVDHNR